MNYSSTQFELPDYLAKKVRRLGTGIPDDELAADGREALTHITVKYGIHTTDVELVQLTLDKQAPVAVTFGKTALFKASESGTDVDVLYVSVISPELEALNQKLTERLAHTTTQSSYVPHITIAYLKAGEGEKYVGSEFLAAQEFTFTLLTFAASDGNRYSIYLSNDGVKTMFEAVKFTNDEKTEITGPGIPFGGPFKNRAGEDSDLHGEFFTKNTNFAFDWFQERPLLYQHGKDNDVKLVPVGRVKSWMVGDKAVTTQAILDKNSEYFEAIREAVDKGGLYFSSGAMGHLVQIDKQTGEIKTWPWVELSLTPTPANFYASVDFVTAQKHFKDAGIEFNLTDPAADKQPADKKSSGRLVIAGVKSLFDDVLAEIMEPDMWQLYNAYIRVVCQIKQLHGVTEGTSVSINPEAMLDEAVAQFMGLLREVSLKFISDESDNYYPYRSVELEKIKALIDAKQDGAMVRLSLVDHSAAVMAANEELFGRVKVICTERVKDGRVLSAANRDKLRTLHTKIGEAHSQMGDLLDQTEPKKAEAEMADKMIEQPDSKKSDGALLLKARALSLLAFQSGDAATEIIND